MHWLTTFLTDLGSVGIDIFWLPVGIWTVVAAIAAVLLRLFEEKVAPIYHYHSRVAMLWGLAAGVGISALLYALPESTSGGTAIPAKFFVIHNPITITATATSTGINWWSPALWMGIGIVSCGIFAIGALLKLGWDFMVLRLFSRRLLSAEPGFDSKISSQNKHLLHLSKADLFFSDAVAVPFTFGAKQKQIVLPVQLQADTQKMNMALRHELMHIYNNDYLINTTVKVIKALFILHPLVHKLARNIEEYREMYCDQQVLQDTNISQKGYAKLLFELSPQPVFKSEAAVNMAVRPSTLKKRIQIMKSSRKHTTSFRRSFSIMLIFTLIVTVLMACSDMEDNGITRSEVEDAQMKMNTDGSINVNDPLYVINGEVIEPGDKEKQELVSRMKPEYIQSIDILKGENATKEYGEKGKNGVIKITLVDKEKAMEDLRDESPKQSKKTQKTDDEIYVTVEKNPELIGGQQALYRNLGYPQKCREANIEGRVFLNFVVTKEGDVTDAKVTRGIGNGCDEAALNAIDAVKFKPGTQNGKPVNVQYSLSILFKLANRDNQAIEESTSDESAANLQKGVVMNQLVVVGYGSYNDGQKLNVSPVSKTFMHK